MSDVKVTSLSTLKGYMKGELVELPGFSETQPFIARLTRPSILNLVKEGKIPNSLLSTATELFDGGMDSGMDSHDESVLNNLFGVMDVLCEATFVEPRYSEMKEAGIVLTDEQYIAVFNYTQQGVKALESFRPQS